MTGLPKTQTDRLLFAAGLFVLMLAMPAWAHDILIDVDVEDASVVVTITYADGTRPAEATVVYSRDGETELLRTGLDLSGRSLIDLDLARDGMIIEAFDTDGHETYRILTPTDLEEISDK